MCLWASFFYYCISVLERPMIMIRYYCVVCCVLCDCVWRLYSECVNMMYSEIQESFEQQIWIELTIAWQTHKQVNSITVWMHAEHDVMRFRYTCWCLFKTTLPPNRYLHNANDVAWWVVYWWFCVTCWDKAIHISTLYNHRLAVYFIVRIFKEPNKNSEIVII